MKVKTLEATGNLWSDRQPSAAEAVLLPCFVCVFEMDQG